MKKKLILMLLLLTACTALVSICAYAEGDYPWRIVTPSGAMNEAIIYAGGDEYAIWTSFARIDETVTCGFKALALFNSDDKLIAVSTSQNTDFGKMMFRLTSTQVPAYYKVYAWDSPESMQPVAQCQTYPVKDGLYFTLPEGKDQEVVQTIKIKLIGATAVEAKFLRPSYTCYFWKEDADLLDWYADQEFTDIENGQFSVKENGEYLIYVKDQNGTQYFQWAQCYNIKAPEPKLYFESACWGDGETAYLAIGIESQNSNAEITEMGLLNYCPEQLVGGYPNSNAEETKYLELATPVKEGDVIEVTEPCGYTLVVKDSWGNTGMYALEIRDVNHERVQQDHWDRRYYYTEPY